MDGSIVCEYCTTVARHSSSLRPFTALLCHKAHIRLLIFLPWLPAAGHCGSPALRLPISVTTSRPCSARETSVKLRRPLIRAGTTLTTMCRSSTLQRMAEPLSAPGRYFICADTVLIMQYIYYGTLQRRREKLRLLRTLSRSRSRAHAHAAPHHRLQRTTTRGHSLPPYRPLPSEVRASLQSNVTEPNCRCWWAELPWEVCTASRARGQFQCLHSQVE